MTIFLLGRIAKFIQNRVAEVLDFDDGRKLFGKVDLSFLSGHLLDKAIEAVPDSGTAR